MSYQPIQMPQSGLGDAIGSVGDALVQAAQMQRQRRLDALAVLQYQGQQKRQGQQDFQAAYLQAQKLAASGDINAAQALMAPFGGQVAQRELPGAAPMAAPAAPAAQMQQPQGLGSEPVDAISTPLSAPQAPVSPQPAAPGSQRTAGPELMDPNAIAEDTAAADWQSTARPEAPRTSATPAASPPANPLVAAAQGDKAKQKRMASFIRGSYGGRDYSIDPEAMRAQRGDMLDALVDQSNDPMVRELYPQMRPWLVASNQDVDPQDVFRNFQATARARQAEQNAAVKQSQFDRTFDQRAELTDKRLHQSDVNSIRAADARIRAAALMSMPDLKNDAANRNDIGRLQTEVKNFFTVADAKGQLKGLNSLHAADVNINQQGDDSVGAHRDALIQLARFFRGSIPTEGEMKLLYDKMGGVPGAVDQFLTGLLNGDISDAQVMNLQRSTKLALGEAELRRSQMFKGLGNVVGPNSPYQNMGPAVNSIVRGYGQLYGVDDMPDVISVDPGFNGTVLGSGARPMRPAAKPPAPRPAPQAKPPASAEDYLKEQGL